MFPFSRTSGPIRALRSIKWHLFIDIVAGDPLVFRLLISGRKRGCIGRPPNEKERLTATIGTLTKDGAGYTGTIETLTLPCDLSMSAMKPFV
jgi:hypothetical protein